MNKAKLFFLYLTAMNVIIVLAGKMLPSIKRTRKIVTRKR